MKNNNNPFVVGKLSIPLVLFPIATALAFAGVVTSHMVGHLSLLNCQGAAGLGGAAVVIQFILYVPRTLYPVFSLPLESIS